MKSLKGFVKRMGAAMTYNGATLSGSIDIIVIEGPDGILRCTPFHVRFGKFKIFQPSKKSLVVRINGEQIPVKMKLDPDGAGFFKNGTTAAEEFK
jgi:phosphatidate phosphatase LPIN